MRNPSASPPLDLTGRWRVRHRVERSLRPSFVGLSIEFQVSFLQDGPQLAGEGEKFLVDDAPAPPGETSRLAITGWIDGRNVRLSLLETAPQNADRTIYGEIFWQAVSADRLVGEFRVDLACTGGRSEALRYIR